ncbi:MAG: FHA domain-containing protein [Verrucomicrobiae bacterium]|nr:FHA domain-containing protein [Verrucomicrobiae bacterium]
MAKLVVVSEALASKVFELTEDKLTIGRLPDNSIRLEDASVSGHHAVLSMNQDEYSVRDLNSTNGTRVNGQKVVEAKLLNGDILTLGHIELRYESNAKKLTKPLPPPKKGIDLSETSPINYKPPPKSFTSASPFKKKKGPQKMLQYGLIGLGAVILILVVVILFLLVSSK